MTDLTPKQLEFCRQYLVDLNATQAAIRAGYSERTANEQGSRLLANVRVRDEIERLGVKRAKRTNFDADRVLEEIQRIATVNIKDVVRWGMKEVAVPLDEDGKPLPPEEAHSAVGMDYVHKPFVEPINSDDLPDEITAAIAEVRQTRDGIAIKMHSKSAGVELAARHFGMLKEKLEISADDDLSAVLAAARARAAG